MDSQTIPDIIAANILAFIVTLLYGWQIGVVVVGVYLLFISAFWRRWQ